MSKNLVAISVSLSVFVCLLAFHFWKYRPASVARGALTASLYDPSNLTAVKEVVGKFPKPAGMQSVVTLDSWPDCWIYLAGSLANSPNDFLITFNRLDSPLKWSLLMSISTIYNVENIAKSQDAYMLSYAGSAIKFGENSDIASKLEIAKLMYDHEVRRSYSEAFLTTRICVEGLVKGNGEGVLRKHLL